MRQWRLIHDQPTSGALNMARDSAILDAVERGESPPTLRLYGWTPYCLSLGVGQRSREADAERLAAMGWELVRRPTGGKAILHGDELTYSVTLPMTDDLAAGGVVESYRALSGGLLNGLTHLGAAVRADAKRPDDQPASPVCFDMPSYYEITVNGRKLVGSAQVRRKSALLQHGSLPLTGDIARICDALVYSTADARAAAKHQVRDRATTLESALGYYRAWQAAADALVRGFSEAFDIEFREESYSSAEHDAAQRLTNEVYANPTWTLRR